MFDVMEDAFERRRRERVSGIKSRNIRGRGARKWIEPRSLLWNFYAPAYIRIKRVCLISVLVKAKQHLSSYQLGGLDDQRGVERRRYRAARRHQQDVRMPELKILPEQDLL